MTDETSGEPGPNGISEAARIMGRLGGRARAEALTPEQLSAISAKAGRARARKAKQRKALEKRLLRAKKIA